MSSIATLPTTVSLSSDEKMELRELVDFLSQEERKYFLSIGDKARKILAIAAFLKKKKDEICSLSEERKTELKTLWDDLEPSHHSFLRTFKVKTGSFAKAARKGVTPEDKASAHPVKTIVQKKCPQAAAATKQTSLPDVKALTRRKILSKFEDLSFAKNVPQHRFGKWTIYTAQCPTQSTADRIIDELRRAFPNPNGEWHPTNGNSGTFAVNVTGLSIEEDFKTALSAYVDLRVSELDD